MAEYCFKYYTFKASIIKQNIIIKDVLKIEIFKNFKLEFKIYLIVINDCMWKNKKLEKDKTLFKTIKKKPLDSEQIES